MTFKGTIKEWEEWTETKIIETGDYIFNGLLQSVKINMEINQGLYYDENIWISYK